MVGPHQRIPCSKLSATKNTASSAELVIDYTFASAERVYFCMTVPFSYADTERYLETLLTMIPASVAYSDQVLCETQQGRRAHLLSLTDHASRATRKPVILITARVHPGEMSASFCLMGVLEFLLSPFSLQALLLRKMFQFLIVPLLNPDGAHEGNYRMDLKGVNLNRVYVDPDPHQHPTIFHIRSEVLEIAKEGRLHMHFDLHSHSNSGKPAFIYGNALDCLVSQTQSELYCQLL